MKHFKPSQQGFTLIELVVVLASFSLVVLATSLILNQGLKLFETATTTTDENRDRMIARRLLAKILPDSGYSFENLNLPSSEGPNFFELQNNCLARCARTFVLRPGASFQILSTDPSRGSPLSFNTIFGTVYSLNIGGGLQYNPETAAVLLGGGGQIPNLLTLARRLVIDINSSESIDDDVATQPLLLVSDSTYLDGGARKPLVFPFLATAGLPRVAVANLITQNPVAATRGAIASIAGMRDFFEAIPVEEGSQPTVHIVPFQVHEFFAVLKENQTLELRHRVVMGRGAGDPNSLLLFDGAREIRFLRKHVNDPSIAIEIEGET